MSIKSDAKNGQQYRKWLFALSEKLCKIGMGFISNFLLKVRVLHLTILKRKNQGYLWRLKQTSLSFVWFYQSVFLSKFVAFLPRTVKRIVTALMPSLLFRSFSFSASFKNSSPREKVGNCLRFWTGGWSLCFFPSWSRNIWICFPTLTKAARAKKNSGKAICSRHQRAASTIEIWSTLTYIEFDCAALLAMI